MLFVLKLLLAFFSLLLILSLTFLLSLGLVAADRKEEYSQIQQEIERISRDLEVEHHFNRIEDQGGLHNL